MSFFPYFLFAALIVFPWFIISKALEYNPKRQSKAMSKAIELGHVCTAYLKKKRYIGNGHDSKNFWLSYSYICTYTYEYKGKRYETKMHYETDDMIKDELTLYFVNNPSKASLPNSIPTNRIPWIIKYLIVAAVIIFIAKVL